MTYATDALIQGREANRLRKRYRPRRRIGRIRRRTRATIPAMSHRPDPLVAASGVARRSLLLRRPRRRRVRPVERAVASPSAASDATPRPPQPTAAPSPSAAAVVERRPGRRCHLRRGRGAGRRRSAASSRAARSSASSSTRPSSATMITKQFDEDTPPAYLAANERLYKALGLIPATTSLRDLTLDLLERRGRRLLPERRGQALRRLEERRTRARTSGSTSPTSTTTRSRTRTPRSSRTRTGSSTRATGSSPAQAVYEGDATPADDPVGGGQPEPGRAPRGRRRGQRPGGAGRPRRGRRRSCATR